MRARIAEDEIETEIVRHALDACTKRTVRAIEARTARLSFREGGGRVGEESPADGAGLVLQRLSTTDRSKVSFASRTNARRLFDFRCLSCRSLAPRRLARSG